MGSVVNHHVRGRRTRLVERELKLGEDTMPGYDFTFWWLSFLVFTELELSRMNFKLEIPILFSPNFQIQKFPKFYHATSSAHHYYLG